MKSLKSILEASILADIDDQLESGDEALKSMIIDWLKANVESIQENKLKFNLNVSPIMVDYAGDIKFNYDITAFTDGTFQWGKIEGNFNCYFCKSLTTLEGAPKSVEGKFNCNHCYSLTSLKGAPEKVGGYFTCSHCKSLTTLEGAPKSVEGSFVCSDCRSLKSLKGAPKEVGENFACSCCGRKFTVANVNKVSNVKGEIFVKQL